MSERLKVFKLVTGEIIVSEIKRVVDGMYLLDSPCMLVPQQQGLGISPIPFADYDEDILLNPSTVSILSKPESQLKEAYEDWLKELRARKSGIVLSNSMPKGPKMM